MLWSLSFFPSKEKRRTNLLIILSNRRERAFFERIAMLFGCDKITFCQRIPKPFGLISPNVTQNDDGSKSHWTEQIMWLAKQVGDNYLQKCLSFFFFNLPFFNYFPSRPQSDLSSLLKSRDSFPSIEKQARQRKGAGGKLHFTERSSSERDRKFDVFAL